MVALGVAAEYKGKNITAHSLWPATIIESLASINFQLGERDAWRKATILSDATLAAISEGPEFTGQQLIDDTCVGGRNFFASGVSAGGRHCDAIGEG